MLNFTLFCFINKVYFQYPSNSVIEAHFTTFHNNALNQQ